jgi:hypothetical protein
MPDYTPTDYEAPDWENGRRVHEWKNYISEELQALWETFSTRQKIAIARNASDLAGREDWD